MDTPRPNTPSFTTLVKYPKTQSEIRDLIDSKEFSLETPLFVALVPTQYGTGKNMWNLVPAIVYNAEQGVYRVGSRTCGQYEKAGDYFAFHAIMLEFNGNELDFVPSYVFISDQFVDKQTHVSELFYPLPPDIYAMLMDSLPAIAHSEAELNRIESVWGQVKNNAMFHVWHALQARKQLIRNTLDIEAEEGKGKTTHWSTFHETMRFHHYWVDPVNVLQEQGVQTIGDVKRAGQAGTIHGGGLGTL